MTLPVKKEAESLSRGAALPSLYGSRPYIEVPIQPDIDFERPVRWGLWLLGIGFGGFLAWAALAPLDEGVPASAVVSVDSKRKRIEHLTGGIVEKILVKEGQQVREGQELIVLNEVQSKASLNSTLSQWRTVAATEARLQAERQGAKSITFPPQLMSMASDPEAASVMRGQEELFRSRRIALEGELRIIRESVRGLELQLKSLEQVGAGRQKQVQLFEEQLNSFRNLNRGGFVSRNQLLELERQLSEVQGKQSEDLANTAGINAKLAEFRMKGAQREVEYRREVESLLMDTQKEAATLNEKLFGLRDTHQRLVIRAPVAGTVVDLAFHTVDGVVKPGDRILDIVPAGDELIIEAQVSPRYVDQVRAGLPANVHFDAYMARAERPVISGTVDVVSADALTDQKNGTTYYAMRVRVSAPEVKRLGDLKLQPGMQATVMVKTGERTLLVYLARPVLRRFTSALSEI